MGIEKGTLENPTTAGKLEMLVGCGLIVSQTQKILLTNPGWDKRLRAVTLPLFEMHQVSGKGALVFALNRIIALGPEEFPLLYIADIGRKKADLVANLKLTHSKAQIRVCSGESVFRINTDLLHAIRAMQQEDKSGWKKRWGGMKKAFHHKDTKAQRFLGLPALRAANKKVFLCVFVPLWFKKRTVYHDGSKFSHSGQTGKPDF